MKKLICTVALAAVVAGCGGSNRGDGSSLFAMEMLDSFGSFVLKLINSTDENADPDSLESVNETSPNDSNPAALD